MNNNMLESLESRQMYSATPVSDATPAPVQEPAALKIKFTDILISSKVSMQDFHFVAKMSKASPKLFLA